MGEPTAPTADKGNKPSETENGPARFNPILRYDEYYDFRTYSYRLRKTAKPEKRLTKKQAVLVIRRVVDPKGRFVGTEIDIKSPILANIMRDINKDVEGNELSKTPPQATSEFFFHSRRQLMERLDEERQKKEPDATLIRDVKVALDYIAEDHGATIQNMESLMEAKSITWELVQALFVPNMLVCHRHDLTEQIQILKFKYIRRKHRENFLPYWQIMCDQITHDGTKFGLAKNDELEIDIYEGAQPIDDLIVFPLDWFPDSEKALQHAIERGKKFASLSGHSYREISGAAMREVTNEAFKRKRFKFASYGRIMIDPAAFRTFCPNITYNYSVHKSLDPSCLTDEQYAICTPVALGFCFGVKMWGGFAVDRLADIKWTDEAFPSLVLDPDTKSLIHSLVSQHSSESKSFDDIVQGKGRGLIGLLSGRPGCGKTLTAEAVSEQTRRPLYTVSAGELGVKPEELDKHLTNILELSTTWDAVLLLDEADVFLQARNDTDINRNALVSIFLRQLEYFQGILILTTNRIGSCDPAFESRIHFSVHYPDLDIEARKRIWSTFWKKATAATTGISTDSTSQTTDTNGKPSGDITASDLDELAETALNGRQIKNVVCSAQSIALQNKEDLSLRHVQSVLHVVQNWQGAAAGAQ